MIRYITNYSNENELEKDIWFPDKEPPDTPYLKIKVKVVEKERRYVDSDRICTRSFRLFGRKIQITTVSKKRMREGVK